VASTLHEFVQAFKRADRKKQSSFKDIEERLSYHFGPIAMTAMDLVHQQLTEKQQAVEKRAEETPKTHVYPLNEPMYAIGVQLIDKLQFWIHVR